MVCCFVDNGIYLLRIQPCAASLERSSRSKALAHAADTRLLTAYGTLYRALGRLEKMGLVRSRPEDPHIAAQENRPVRRLYTLTAAGEAAARDAAAAEPRLAPVRKPLEGLT